jgi:hypothetical protein
MPDNLDSFNAGIQNMLDPAEAAAMTFTGKMAARMGFANVRIEQLVGSPGEYTKVSVVFGKVTNIDKLAAALQIRARKGEKAIQLGRELVFLAGDGWGPMIFIAAFRQAFNVPVRVLNESVSWVGFGYDDVRDEDFSAQLDPYIELWWASDSRQR